MSFQAVPQTSQMFRSGKRRPLGTSPSDLGHDQPPVRHPFRSADRRRCLQHDGRRQRRGGHDLCRREAVGGQSEADRLQDTAEGVGIA